MCNFCLPAVRGNQFIYMFLYGPSLLTFFSGLDLLGYFLFSLVWILWEYRRQKTTHLSASAQQNNIYELIFALEDLLLDSTPLPWNLGRAVL